MRTILKIKLIIELVSVDMTYLRTLSSILQMEVCNEKIQKRNNATELLKTNNQKSGSKSMIDALKKSAD